MLCLSPLMNVVNGFVLTKADPILADSIHQIIKQYEQQSNEKIKTLERQKNRLKKDIGQLKNENKELTDRFDVLEKTLSETDSVFSTKVQQINDSVSHNQNLIANTSNQLGEKIEETGNQSQQHLLILNSKLGKAQNYGLALVVLLIICGVLAYVFLKKQIKIDGQELSLELLRTQNSLDAKRDFLRTQVWDTLENHNRLFIEHFATQKKHHIAEGRDHNFALQLADEIIWLENKIIFEEHSDIELKKMNQRLLFFKQRLRENGYQMPDLLNQPYKPTLKAAVNFRPDSLLEKDQKLITKVIKPQLRFQGKIIQPAQIEVSQGY